jgi:hypothetical protein
VATHRLPDTIQVPSPRSRMRHRTPPRRFSLRTRYPDKLTSTRLAPGILRLGLRNPGFWALLGGLHTALLVALVFALDYGRHFGGGLFSIQTLRASFPYLVLAAVYLYAAVLFAKIDRHSPRRTARIAGLAHGLAQLALGTAWAVGVFDLHHDRPSWLPDTVLAVLAVAATFVVVGFAATLLTGIYLLLASQLDVNLNEVFAGQSIEDYKGFLRLHVSRDGDLTIYPIRLAKVCHAWRTTPDDAAGDPWLRPAGEPLRAEFIEAPIRVPRHDASR